MTLRPPAVVASSLLAFLTAFPAIAFAHARLLDPVPRSTLALKSGPCGGIPRTVAPFVTDAGSSLEVTWEEYIEHPGYFRILFSTGSDRDFRVLLDDIPDKSIPVGRSSVLYSATVTLPGEPCDAGTLQLIQVMTENPSSPSLYFSCADVRLVVPGPKFRRGDWNSDGETDLSDVLAALFFLFESGGSPACPDAGDATDDGSLDLADPVAVLESLFLDAGPLPSPGVVECGADPTPDDALPECLPSCP